MTITEEDFSAWRDNEVTQAVFTALTKMIGETKAQWDNVSWKAGNADPIALADLRARAEILSDLIELSYEDLESKLEPTESH